MNESEHSSSQPAADAVEHATNDPILKFRSAAYAESYGSGLEGR